jgi:predicted RNA-binding protein with PIN domain
MKKTVNVLGTVILLLVFPALAAFASSTEAEPKTADVEIVYNEESATADAAGLIEMRIREIREMDRSELTAEEKQELRNELRDIKSEANQPGGTIYIGIGTVLLIAILILLLR